MKMSFSPAQTMLAAAALFTIVFLAYFPPMFASIDEHEYLKNASLVQTGELKGADPLLYCGGVIRSGEYVSTYHIGKSFSLIPFTWGPFPFALISGLLIHLLNTLLFVFILRQLKIDERWALLFFFFPVLVWESRTLFSETFALTFLLAGTFFYTKENSRDKLFAGLFLGLAAFVRYETILIAAGFAIGLFWKERHSLTNLKSSFWQFVIGGAIAAILLLSWNAYFFGSPFSTQLGSPGRLVETFPQPLFVHNLLEMVAVLLIAYPLMLASPFFSKRAPQVEILLGTFFTLILFAQTNNISVYEFFSPLTFTGRMRYFIPIAGLLLLPYVDVLSKHLGTLTKRIPQLTPQRFFSIAFLGLLASTVILSSVHQNFLEGRSTVSQQVLETIPDGSLTIGSSDDCVYFLPLLTNNRLYARVDNIDIESLFASRDDVFVLDLTYGNSSDSDVRQDVIDAERKKMKDFIAAHANELTLVYSSDAPHHVRIYEKK